MRVIKNDLFNKKKRKTNLNLQVHVVENCQRAIVCDDSISLYDLEKYVLIARFTSDVPVCFYFSTGMHKFKALKLLINLKKVVGRLF